MSRKMKTLTHHLYSPQRSNVSAKKTEKADSDVDRKLKHETLTNTSIQSSIHSHSVCYACLIFLLSCHAWHNIFPLSLTHSLPPHCSCCTQKYASIRRRHVRHYFTSEWMKYVRVRGKNIREKHIFTCRLSLSFSRLHSASLLDERNTTMHISEGLLACFSFFLQSISYSSLAWKTRHRECVNTESDSWLT